MIWIIGILVIVALIFFTGCSPKPIIPNPPGPEPLPPDPPITPLPDPLFYRWHLVNTDTLRWAGYVEYMTNTKKITKDSLLALEMMKKVDGKPFYVWTAEVGDYWDLPDEVWERGTCDCDGFARLTADVLGRFIKYPDVWWLEYYGYYREYYLDNDVYKYRIVLGGHAICVYKKNNELLAFSNTNWWWNQNFEDFVSIGELTFPEGIAYIRCRNWETGVLQWIQEAPDNGILEGSNVFSRSKRAIHNVPKLDKRNLPRLT